MLLDDGNVLSGSPTSYLLFPTSTMSESDDRFLPDRGGRGNEGSEGRREVEDGDKAKEEKKDLTCRIHFSFTAPLSFIPLL